MTAEPFLPGTGRGTSRRLVEGAGHGRAAGGGGPSTTSCGGGPPPRAGEEFALAAGRLAGIAGVAFGWSPDSFWRATPAELGALVMAVTGEVAQPADGAVLARLREAFPDG